MTSSGEDKPAPRASAKPRYIHASAVIIGDDGILVRGPSRAGKSSLVLALLEEAAGLSCFARLIGDDRIGVEVQNGVLVLSGHPAIQGKIEKRGEGILAVAFEPAATARYVIDLLPQSVYGPQSFAAFTEIERIILPLVTLAFAAKPSDRAKMLLRLIGKAGAVVSERQG